MEFKYFTPSFSKYFIIKYSWYGARPFKHALRNISEVDFLLIVLVKSIAKYHTYKEYSEYIWHEYIDDSCNNQTCNPDINFYQVFKSKSLGIGDHKLWYLKYRTSEWYALSCIILSWNRIDSECFYKSCNK